MTNLDTIVAVYSDHPGPDIDWSALESAETDWWALEAAVQAGEVKIADAALVENRNGEALILERESHHGWGQGAVVGAVVGILFPPTIIGAAKCQRRSRWRSALEPSRTIAITVAM